MTTRILAALLASAAMLTACGTSEPAATEAADANQLGNDAAAGAQDGIAEPAPSDESELVNNSSDEGEAATVPAHFHGEWNSDLSACGKPSLTRLIVNGDSLAFYESSGAVREVDRESDRVVSVASIYQGEGETWQATRRLSLSPDGDSLTVSGSGATLTRRRCP